MKNKTAKQISKDYKLAKLGVAAAYAVGIVVGIVLLKVSTLIGIVLLALLLGSAKGAFDRLREKTVESVIYDELDAEKFAEIVELGTFGKKSTRFELLAAMYTGDHEKVLALTDADMKKEINPVNLCNDLYKRGFVYFEEENMTELKKTVSEFNKLKQKNAKYAAIFENYSVFEKYDAMIDGDYEYIVDICEYDLKNDNPKHQNHKLTRLNVSYYRAVALYKLERYDDASEAFAEIIDLAPKTYKATLAKNFLSRPEMQKNTENADE